MEDPMTDRRVCFDFEISFSNGGGIQGQDFRLDIEGEDIDDEALAAFIIRDLRLLMVNEVRILNKRIIAERHKRATPTAPESDSKSAVRVVDLSHTIEQGMITYKGLPGPLICDHLSRLKSREIYAEGTEFQIGKIEMVGNTGTYIDMPFHRYATDMTSRTWPSSASRTCRECWCASRAVQAGQSTGTNSRP
jgi:arylformamidase